MCQSNISCKYITGHFFYSKFSNGLQKCFVPIAIGTDDKVITDLKKWSILLFNLVYVK
jgi:hypothetical protein